MEIPEDGVTFKDMHQYHCCPELGAEKRLVEDGVFQAAMRRVVCNCEACDTTIRLPWEPGMPGKDQPRFKNPAACVLRPVMGDANKWYIVDVVPSDKSPPQDTVEVYQDVFIHIASAIAKDVKVGKIGAIATPVADDAPDGYYLMKFTCLPYSTQTGDGRMVVKGKYLYKLLIQETGIMRRRIQLFK